MLVGDTAVVCVDSTGDPAEVTVEYVKTVLAVEVTFKKLSTVIIRVIWKIRNDECILILRKACGKKDKKGFDQLATEEIEQIATRLKVSLSRLTQFFLLNWRSVDRMVIFFILRHNDRSVM